MPYSVVNLVIDRRIAGLCAYRYPGHRKGCPNLGKPGCPPLHPPLGVDLLQPVYAVWATFEIGQWARAMKEKHPKWTDRQCRNLLYWQPKLRKKATIEVHRFLRTHPGLVHLGNPEANCVNFTKTMASVGIELEWPPTETTYAIALFGTPSARRIRNADRISGRARPV